MRDIDHAYTWLGMLAMQAYLIVLGWTDAFSLGDWFPLHVVILAFLAVFYAPVCALKYLNGTASVFRGPDIILLLAVGVYVVSSLLLWNEKTFNYAAAYIFTFGIGYAVLKVLLYELLPSRRILNANLIGILLSSIFALLEFSIELATGFDIQRYIPRDRVTSATFLYGTLPRSYGLATEPTVLAMYLNTLGPLAFWYLGKILRKKPPLLVILRSSIIGGWLVTFSVGGYVFMLVGIVSALMLYATNAFLRITIHGYRDNGTGIRRGSSAGCRGGSYKVAYWIMGIFALAGILVNVDPINDYSRLAFKAISEKVSLGGGSLSVETRKVQWHKSIEIIKDNRGMPQGAGLSTLEDGMSSLNWYLLVAREGGILSVAAFLAFLIGSAFIIAASRVEAKYYVFVGFVAAALHLTIVSTFFHPFLWVLIAVFHVLEKKGNQLGRSLVGVNIIR